MGVFTEEQIHDICELYRCAADRKKQIKILMELYLVKRDDICAVLIDHGYSVPGKEKKKVDKKENAALGSMKPTKPVQTARPTYGPEVITKVLAAIDAGETRTAVSEKTGVSIPTIGKWVRKRDAERKGQEKKQEVPLPPKNAEAPASAPQPKEARYIPEEKGSAAAACQAFTSAWAQLQVIMPASPSEQAVFEGYRLRAEGFLAGIAYAQNNG